MSAPFSEQDLQEAAAPVDVTVAADEAAQIETQDLINLLRGYMYEAKTARESGIAPRDAVWGANWRAFWSDYDFSAKASWQSQERLPEVANFTERFAAAIREALVQAGQFWVTKDPLDPGSKLARFVDQVIQFMLDRSGRSITGQSIGFAHPFGLMMKSGALMATSAAVTWDFERKTIRVDPVDARELFFDPTGRGLYRIRRQEIDWHTLESFKDQVDDAGNKIYDAEAIDRLQRHEALAEKASREESSGHGQDISLTPRNPVIIDEYLCRIVDTEGRSLGSNQLVVMANDREIIRGPEQNPFSHGLDWIVYSPMISVPFSVYGKTYVESFRQVAETFNEMTNLLLDAVQTTAMNAYEATRSLMEDPTQLDDGISPNTIIWRDEEAPVGSRVIETIDLGRVPGEAIAIWNGIEKKLGDAAAQSELALGQLPAKGDITATEINTATSGAAALTRSVATDIEEQDLDPILELVWATSLQFMDLSEGSEISVALGPEATSMFLTRREDFQNRTFRMKSKGITGLLARANKIRAMTNALGLIGQNEILSAAFEKEYSATRLVGVLFRDLGVDDDEIRKTEDEKQADAQAAQAQQAQQDALAPQPANGGSPPRQPGIGDAQ